MTSQRTGTSVLTPSTYEGRCWVCGSEGVFRGDERPMRESFQCSACGGSLRYQAQAAALVSSLSRDGARSFAELATEDHVRSMSIYEPGTLGPFRSYLSRLPGYVTSAFWPDVDEGEYRDGMRCENLMHLTYADRSFDLVITSDVFEHVRRPIEGFRDVRRVLRDRGMHIFSIPVLYPLVERSVPRVDTSTDDDVHLLEPHHHNGHLVYTDFGADLLGHLDRIGTPTEAVRFAAPAPGLERVVTFRSTRTT